MSMTVTHRIISKNKKDEKNKCFMSRNLYTARVYWCIQGGEGPFIVSTPSIVVSPSSCTSILEDAVKLCHVMMDWVPPSGIRNTFLSGSSMTKYFRTSLFLAMSYEPGRQKK